MNTIQKSKHINKVAVFLLILACFFSVTGLSVKAATSTSIWLPVRQIVETTNNSVSPDGQTFQYSLTPLEAGNPMPEGSSDTEYILTLTGQERVEIQIDYSTVGRYTYNMKQIADESREGVTYSKEEYLVTVEVKPGNNRRLVSDVTVEKRSDRTKVGELEFTTICNKNADVPNEDRESEEGQNINNNIDDNDIDNNDINNNDSNNTDNDIDNTDSNVEINNIGGEEITGNGSANGATMGVLARAVSVGEGLAGLGNRIMTTGGDTGEDLEELDSEATPRGLRNTDAWALVNLLLSIATVICTLILLLTYLKKRDESEDEEEESVEKRKRNGIPRILSIVVSVASVIFFLLTEDVTLPLRLTDQYTWIMAAGFLIQVIDIVYIRMNRKEKKENKAYT